ncbi:hypothetical protein BSLA_02r1928 [Burkholderia stabilis]|nr:hypothetical protein BSLA_02r1928 [Burkholderia stabilis]
MCKAGRSFAFRRHMRRAYLCVRSMKRPRRNRVARVTARTWQHRSGWGNAGGPLGATRGSGKVPLNMPVRRC